MTNKNRPSVLQEHNCPVALRLKELRLQHRLSQKQLGIDAGIDPASASARMNQYERGKHVPDYQTLQRLAGILQVPVSFFYAADTKDAEFFKRYYQLLPRQQKKISQLMQRISFYPERILP
jgi:transcriptional regulator with XRE-family HTH domain